MAISTDFAHLTDVVISANGEEVFRINGKVKILIYQVGDDDGGLNIVNLHDGGKWVGTLYFQRMGVNHD